MSKCIRGTWRGMGPSAYARIAEIMSGRAISQQGLATTCKDPLYRETEVSGRDLVWRMSDEGGVAPSDVVLDAAPQEVTPAAGKGALGTWRAVAGPGR